MKLPNGAFAIVAEEKITTYLLNPANRNNKGKAAFFSGFGFTLERWYELANALLAHARTHDVTEMEHTEYGAAYNVRGPLVTPIGRTPVVLTG